MKTEGSSPDHAPADPSLAAPPPSSPPIAAHLLLGRLGAARRHRGRREAGGAERAGGCTAQAPRPVPIAGVGRPHGSWKEGLSEMAVCQAHRLLERRVLLAQPSPAQPRSGVRAASWPPFPARESHQLELLRGHRQTK